jgi:hypothetical protein
MGVTILLPEEVEELTGYKRKADQRAWLVRNGITFLSNRFGQPVVARTALLERMGQRHSNVVAPDWDALRELQGGPKAS